MSEGALTAIPPRPVRFGILCNGPTLPAWQARAVEALLRVRGVILAMLIFPEKSPSDHTVSRRISGDPLLLRAYLGVRPPRALRRVDMAAVFEKIPSLRCREITQEESLQSFDKSDVRHMQEQHLDFLLQLGFGFLRGDVLNAARYGVWSFRHPAEFPHRDVTPCIAPIFDSNLVTAAVLERVTNRRDVVIVLRSGFFRTALHSLRQNIDDVCFGSASWPASVCRDIQSGHTDYLDGPESPAQGFEGRTLSNTRTLRLLAKQTRHAVRRAQQGLTRHEEWCIGIVNAPISAFLDPTREKPVRWLRPPGDDWFIADPFGARVDDAVHILYEDFRYSTSKGLIATMEATAEGPPRVPRVAIELPIPASYPYIVEDRGRIYCVPETSEAREVSLYRAVEFPMKWEKVSTLLTGVAALDGTLFRHEGRWWLAHTDRDAGQYVHLFLWHASTLDGPWEPHPLNPVKSDVRSSRPAGTPFLHEGTLYRPAQDCSRVYGGRIVINRVSRLTPTEFAEQPAAVVEPFAKSPFPDGIHTISRVGDVTLIDSKRYRFIPSAIPYVLRYR
jgi:hypothetical protein